MMRKGPWMRVLAATLLFSPAVEGADCPAVPVDSLAAQCLEAQDQRRHADASFACECWMKGDPESTRPVFVLAEVTYDQAVSLRDFPEEAALLEKAEQLYRDYLTRELHDDARRARARERLDLTRARLGEIPSVVPDPSPPPPPSSAPQPAKPGHMWSFVLFGTSVALAGGAAGTALWTKSSYEDLSTTCAGTPDGCAQSDVDSVQNKALVTNVLLATAGVAAGVGAVLFIMESRQATKRVTISAAPGGLLVKY